MFRSGYATFSQNNSDSTTTPQQVANLASKLVTTTFIEQLRSHIEARTQISEELTQDSKRATAAVHYEQALWEMAGVDSLLSALDGDAMQEAKNIVQTCVALPLTPDEASKKVQRLRTVNVLVDALSGAEL